MNQYLLAIWSPGELSDDSLRATHQLLSSYGRPWRHDRVWAAAGEDPGAAAMWQFPLDAAQHAGLSEQLRILWAATDAVVTLNRVESGGGIIWHPDMVSAG